jgi:hypothetical protein
LPGRLSAGCRGDGGGHVDVSLDVDIGGLLWWGRTHLLKPGSASDDTKSVNTMQIQEMVIIQPAAAQFSHQKN